MTKYTCSKHGDQGGFIGIEINLQGGAVSLPKSLKSRSERRYCMACWIDMMDANLLPLEKTK